MENIMEHFEQMRLYGNCNSVNVNKNLKSIHNSSIFYDLERKSLCYIIKIKKEDIDIPKVKELDFEWQGDSFVIVGREKFFREFCIIVQDIYESIYELKENQNYEILNIIRERIICWKDFIGRKVGKGLSIEEEQGLIGELVTIKYLFEKGITNVIKSWIGPLGEKKDFSLTNSEIETKFKILNGDKLIHINNEEQLYSNKRLYLNINTFNESDEGLTLSEYINDILDIINDEEKDEFIKKIQLVGYNPGKKYNLGRRFLIEEIKFYLVDEDFPRNKSNIGTCNLKYDININSIEKFYTSNAIID